MRLSKFKLMMAFIFLSINYSVSSILSFPGRSHDLYGMTGLFYFGFI